MAQTEPQDQDMGKKWGNQYTSRSDAALAQERADKRAADEDAASRNAGWGAWQASKMVLLLTAIGAVLLTLLIGFQWGGWHTAGGTERIASASADSAVVDRLSTICVAQFNTDPERDAKLATMRDMTSYERAGFITEQGWATMPGDTEPVRNVANACSRMIMEIEP